MKITKKKIDTTIENRILTGLIVSKEFTRQVFPFLRLKYFKNDHAKIIAKWCLEHYSNYEEVPYQEISTILDEHWEELDESNARLILDFLTDISDELEANAYYNHEYVLNQARVYCKKQELEISCKETIALIEAGEVDAAEERLIEYSTQRREIDDISFLFEDATVDDVFSEENEEFFNMGGEIGEFIGNMEPGWLIGLSAPFKRGKTWFLQWMAIQAMLCGLKVLFISLEMSRKQVKKRFMKMMTHTVDPGDFRRIRVPTMDCVHNQVGNCTLEQRVGEGMLRDAGSALPEYNDFQDWTVCTYCRNRHRENFKPYYWFTEQEFDESDRPVIYDKIEEFRYMYEKSLAIRCYPRFTANIRDIKNDLDNLEVENFIPDVILIDYADILKPETSNMVGVEKEDRTWIALAQLAAERSNVVVTPTQLTKEALDANVIKQKHTARWVGKLGHVDAMYAISRTESEQNHGIMRVNCLAHRHREFNPNEQVLVLQSYRSGVVVLDSARRM
ncbi:MAG: hypothetical protein SVK08_01720 [Halobacteriota archaeon]|nr:hypothetical protein [Halobacteriota archaeon]